MRRSVYMLILAMFAVVSGCTKVTTVEKEFGPVDNSGYTLLSADLETLLIEDEARVWPEDAYIGVYGSEQGENERYTIKDQGAGLASAVFYGPVVKGKIAAYYPYDPSYIGNAEGMPVVLDSEQEYDEESDVLTQFMKYTPRAFGYMQDDKLGFIYPNGILHVNIKTYEVLTIKGITISSASSKLAGLGVVRNDGMTEMTESAAQKVSLDCSAGVLSKVGDSYADFYLVVVPGTYEDLEISIELEGEAPLVRMMPPVEVRRVSADDFAITSVTIKTSGGPADFTDTPVEFE